MRTGLNRSSITAVFVCLPLIGFAIGAAIANPFESDRAAEVTNLDFRDEQSGIGTSATEARLNASISPPRKSPDSTKRREAVNPAKDRPPEEKKVAEQHSGPPASPLPAQQAPLQYAPASPLPVQQAPPRYAPTLPEPPSQGRNSIQYHPIPPPAFHADGNSVTFN